MRKLETNSSSVEWSSNLSGLWWADSQKHITTVTPFLGHFDKPSSRGTEIRSGPVRGGNHSGVARFGKTESRPNASCHQLSGPVVPLSCHVMSRPLPLGRALAERRPVDFKHRHVAAAEDGRGWKRAARRLGAAMLFEKTGCASAPKLPSRGSKTKKSLKSSQMSRSLYPGESSLKYKSFQFICHDLSRSGLTRQHNKPQNAPLPPGGGNCSFPSWCWFVLFTFITLLK